MDSLSDRRMTLELFRSRSRVPLRCSRVTPASLAVVAWRWAVHAWSSADRCNLLVFGLTLALGLGLKLHYSAASSDELDWLLRPTAALTQAITGHRFIREAGQGYWCFERKLLMARACAGANYGIVTWWALVFGWVRRHPTRRGKLLWLCSSALIAYLATLLVNALRIAVSLWWGELFGPVGPFGYSGLHRLQGIVIYFLSLLLLYGVVGRASLRTGTTQFYRSLAWPLACYLAVSLLLPMLHGAGASPQFWQHAKVTLGVATGLTALVALLAGGPRLVCRYLRRAEPPLSR